MKIEILEKPLKCKIALLWFKYTLARKVSCILLQIVEYSNLQSILPSIQTGTYMLGEVRLWRRNVRLGVQIDKIRYYRKPFLDFFCVSSTICDLEKCKMTAVISLAIFEPAIALG